MLAALYALLVTVPLIQGRPATVQERQFGLHDSPVSNTLPTNLTQAQIEPFIRPARFARAAYCNSSQVLSLTCGDVCSALGNVDVLVAEGDNGWVPRYFVAHDVDGEQIVVSRQGTNTSDIDALLSDADIFQVPINASWFPNAPSGVLVHDGFQRTFGRTADTVSATVQTAIKNSGVKNVLVIGHSLGAAVSIFDAMMLKTILDPSITVSTVLFGLPRVGNQEWADYVDSTIGTTFTRITNNLDPIPIVPPRIMNYVHPSGEVHIAPGNVTTACPGQENSNCQEGLNLLDSYEPDHRGPYFTAAIWMGHNSCAGHDAV